MRKKLTFVLCLLAGSQAFAQTSIADMVKNMSRQEKILLVVGKGMKISGMNLSSSPTVGVTKDRVDGAAGSTYAIESINLPTMVVADGPAGLRISPTREETPGKTYYCTAFPVGTLLASTWDTALVYQAGRAMGNEVREYGVDVLLAPALNIQRTPLGGRNFEYYSEDPLVSGWITAAMVNGIESNGVGTSIKHFAGNNQETNRNLVNTIVSERALREIYLRGFEIAVKRSDPWTVMSSYNKLNGTYTSQSYDLLTTILRKEWGYKGMVMTDWFGGNNAVEQMKAGNDLLMPGTAAQIKEITDALNDGKLSEAVLDENVARIIKTVLQSPTALNQTYSNTPDLKGHATIARNIAADGMILLKNNAAVLPLAKNIGTIATYGNTSYNFIAGGTGSGDVNEAYTISLVQGLTDAGLKIDEELQKEYTAYIAEQQAKMPPKKFFFELPPPIEERKLTPDAIAEKVKTTAIALITIGRNAGEFQDRKKENDYYLSANELELIKNVSTAYHAAGKKVVVIINAGGVIDVTAWRDQVDGILLTWQGGQEAGHAVADLLIGKVNPSGKLAVTFPVDYSDISTVNNFPGKNTSDKEVKGFGGMSMGFPSEVIYEEGIYVGYRFHNSFKVKTAYPFGFGLSYTNFAYSNLKFSSPNFNGSITVTVDVTNTGKVAGKEAVQLYLSAPAVKLAKPSEELKSFAKTGLLKPGQKQTLKFVLSPKDLASFDVTSTSWIAEAGKYNVLIGASSTDFKLKGSFQLAKELVVEKCNKVVVPQIEIKQLGKQ